MFIKKYHFTYPEVVDNTLQVGNIKLSNFSEVIIRDILLILRIGNSYNFYLPSIGDNDESSQNIVCIFNNIKDYVYKNNILFIKEGTKKEGNWVIIEPNMFSHFLTRLNLSHKKECAPRIPYSGETCVNILDLTTSNGIFVNVDNFYYWIENKVSSLKLTKIYGSIKRCKLYDTMLVLYKNQENFFKNGNLSKPYSNIKEFNYPYDKFAAYLGFSDYDCEYIKCLQVGLTIPTYGNAQYSYTVEFKEPLKSIEFINRDNIELSEEPNFPNFAIDIWKITDLSGQEKFLLQGIGEYQFTLIKSKNIFTL